MPREPRYVALVGIDFVGAGDDLDPLLHAVLELCDEATQEDVVVWKDGKEVVCIVRPSGAVVWLLTPQIVA